MNYILILLIILTAGCATSDRDMSYYIRTDTNEQGTTVYRIGYDSAFGFQYYKQDEFATMGEAEQAIVMNYKPGGGSGYLLEYDGKRIPDRHYKEGQNDLLYQN